MAAVKKSKVVRDTPAEAGMTPELVRAVAEDHGLEPVASPAHKLQKALHDAGFHSEGFRDRPMSNAMLVLSLICVYALAMMMMLGTFTV